MGALTKVELMRSSTMTENDITKQQSLTQSLRKCTRCGVSKPLCEFYIRSNGKPHSWCKDCFADYYREHKSRITSVQRRYRQSEKKLNATIKRYLRKYDSLSKEARRRGAYEIVKVALACGKLIRPSVCQRCGVVCVPDAHHEDYLYPLKVEWLCKACHYGVHAHKRKSDRKFTFAA